MYSTKAKRKYAHHPANIIYGDLKKIRKAFAETTHDVGGITGVMIQDSLANAKNKSVDLKENIANFVSEKPFQSFGIALLSGIFLSRLLHK